ncbi:BSD domain-containing protein 1 [Chamberlinius hualienensis]
MAEAGNANWWGDWVKTVKEKTNSVVEFMKKDLDEFANTVQRETSTFVTSATNTLKEKLKVEDGETTGSVMKRSVSDFLNTVSNAVTLPKEENEDEAIVMRNSEPVILSRFELQVLLLQRESSTYLEDPNEDGYEEWTNNFDLGSKHNELAELMASNVDVRKWYCSLVPAQVSHGVFWLRYFYRVHQLMQAEEKRFRLKQRAERNEPEEINWDDEEDGFGKHVPTAQEMDKLFSDYQKEREEETRMNHSFTDLSREVFVSVPDSATDVSTNPTENGEPPAPSSSTGSTDEEWEKNFDVEVTEDEIRQALSSDTSLIDKKECEEWETWQ